MLTTPADTTDQLRESLTTKMLSFAVNSSAALMGTHPVREMEFHGNVVWTVIYKIPLLFGHTQGIGHTPLGLKGEDTRSTLDKRSLKPGIVHLHEASYSMCFMLRVANAVSTRQLFHSVGASLPHISQTPSNSAQPTGGSRTSLLQDIEYLQSSSTVSQVRSGTECTAAREGICGLGRDIGSGGVIAKLFRIGAW